jgi:hypothetical protein
MESALIKYLDEMMAKLDAIEERLATLEEIVALIQGDTR